MKTAFYTLYTEDNTKIVGMIHKGSSEMYIVVPEHFIAIADAFKIKTLKDKKFGLALLVEPFKEACKQLNVPEGIQMCDKFITRALESINEFKKDNE